MPFQKRLASQAASPALSSKAKLSGHRNLKLLYLLIPLLFAILVGGLSWRQLVLGHQYRQREQRQSLRRILQPAPRGRILAAEGEVLVANRPRFSAIIHLDQLREEFRKAYYTQVRRLREAHQNSGAEGKFRFDWEATLWAARQKVLQSYLSQINSVLGTENKIPLQRVKDHFFKHTLMPFVLFEDLPIEDYARLIQALPLGSRIDIRADTVRSYPHGSLAAHTLGYTRRKHTISQAPDAKPKLHTLSHEDRIGQSGLEKTFNASLSGSPGEEVWLVDRFQYRFEPLKSKPAFAGSDLQTSLDLHLQQVAEAALKGKRGCLIAVKVATGEILALASQPAYDLRAMSPSISRATFKDIESRGAWPNRAIRGLYPPGSVFKIITAIAALRTGKLNPTEKIYCARSFRIGDRNFPEHTGGPVGHANLARALQKSSNVYFYQLAVKVGIDAIAEEARRFGLHEPTGIELPHEETRMLIPDRAWSKRARGFPWRGGDTANVAIGQGNLLSTPLQIAAFIAALARNETRTDLTLLKRPDGEPVHHHGEPIGLSDAQGRELLKGLEAVTEDGGTAWRVHIKGLRLAGKTGTSQIRSQGKNGAIAWFAAFGPVEHPEIAVVAMIESLESTRVSGGSTAAPLARKVLKAWFDKKTQKAQEKKKPKPRP